jgi:decaprenylphospho-beta-D-ribofuranose 2-oxidase
MLKKIANWGNFPALDSKVISFSHESGIRSVISNEDTLIARGNGRCYGDASLAPVTLLTLSFDKILFFDKQNGIVECESGITLDQILKLIVPHGWFLPVSPGTKFITLGGAVASNVHGKNHHIEGPFSKHILELTLQLASGEKEKCSESLNTDLFEATCGGMGLTGIIIRIKFKLKKIETSYIVQKQIKAKNLDEIISLFEKFKDYTYSMAWIDCLKKGKDFGRSILIVGEHAKSEDLDKNKKKNPLAIPSEKKISFPINLPSWMLNKFSIKTFNFFFYNKNLQKEINNVISYEPFFYPLDAILNWNRMYGKKGFIQYQFVVPLNKKEGLIEILNRINKKGMGSFLTVLKQFGTHPSIISFPIEGYTLALDFPVRKGLFEFLDELDKIVLQNGGRIYLTKDARMQPEIFWKTYSGAERFKEIVKKYNPDFKFRSLLSDRLLITKER